MTLITEKAETAKLIVEKKTGGRKIKPLRASMQLDISGSMSGMFRDGTVQNVFDQLLGAALLLDDDGQLDMYVFDDRAEKIGTATSKDHGTYIAKNGIGPRGGTRYGPIMQLVHADLFGRVPGGAMQAEKKGMFSGMFGAKPQPAPTPAGGSQEPAIAFFMTDGDAMDSSEADRILASAAKLPIYWNLVGIGRGSSFSFLNRMADKYANVGFVHMPEVRVSDDAMYNALFTDEFIGWTSKL